jgi:hypothetical protein
MVPVLGERNPSDDDASVEVGTFPPSFKGSPFSLVWGSMGPAKTARAGGEHRRSARRAARPDKAAIPPKADEPSASEPRCSGHVPASLADVIRRLFERRNIPEAAIGRSRVEQVISLFADVRSWRCFDRWTGRPRAAEPAIAHVSRHTYGCASLPLGVH